jgi:hypothetical protein
MRALVRSAVVRTGLRGVVLALAGVVALSSVGHAATIVLRSGNAPVGQPDPLIRYLVEPSGSCGVGFPAAFTAADFAAARTGPNANVVNPYPVWGASLACDPQARWIAPDPNLAPRSALFAYDFLVADPCCYDKVTLDLCWIVDDWLGDLDSGINTGVYLNGVPLPITGGNHSTDTHAIVDVTSIVHCGPNTLYIYNRDAGCVVSGLIFSATLDLRECLTPTSPGTWGKVKAQYR